MNPVLDDDGQDDGSGRLPCAVGLLAATMALMTGHADPAPGAKVDAATLQRLTARRIVSNLFFLQQHPGLPPGLRQVARQLHARWVLLAQPAAPGVPAHTEAEGEAETPLLH